jgi:hypothetical protein
MEMAMRLISCCGEVDRETSRVQDASSIQGRSGSPFPPHDVKAARTGLTNCSATLLLGKVTAIYISYLLHTVNYLLSSASSDPDRQGEGRQPDSRSLGTEYSTVPPPRPAPPRKRRTARTLLD